MYKTTVVVDGMHCSMCESQVKSLVMKILPDASSPLHIEKAH